MKCFQKQNKKTLRGFSLLESLVTIGVIAIIAQAIFFFVSQTIESSRENQAWSLASAIATEQIEVIRNAPFGSVGTQGGIPSGVFPQTQTISRGGIAFTVKIVIKEFDDPFDGDALGTIQGKPVDTVPADYKKAEVNVCWNTRTCANPLRFTSTVAPRTLESASNTGSLFISVINADGDPVPSVTIQVQNSSLVPAINASNTTDINGKLQLLSLPPAISTYHVIATKTGYTSDSTLAPTAQNPNPINPDTTVAVAGVTEVTLIIDEVGSVEITAEVLNTCGTLPGISIQLIGEQLIGSNPDVLKNSFMASTNGSGVASFTNVPWDNYTISISSVEYILAGSTPPAPLTLPAGTDISVRLFLAPTSSHTVLVTVTDAGTGLPVADSQVQVAGNGFDETKTSNQGALQQSNWVGGDGQDTFVDSTRYFTGDGNLDDSSAGQLSLLSTSGTPTFSENFSTTDHRDDSATTADWTTALPFHLVLPGDPGVPGSYLASAVGQSDRVNPVDGLITSVELTATDQLNGETIDYFVTADGQNFEQVTEGVVHTFVSPGTDLRWRAILSTNTPTVTPEITGITLEYSQRYLSATDGWLESSTFNTGGQSTFSVFAWDPQTQPPSTGADAIRFQIASNTDQTTWNYLGPDGTSGTYYTTSSQTLSPAHTNHQYLRYRALLHTDDPIHTPILSNLSIIYSNICLPPGQVFFSPLPANGDYDVTVSRPGYQTSTQTVTIDGNTQVIISLTPDA